MKKLLVTLLALVAFSASAFAASHGMNHEGMAGMDHGKMQHEGMDGMMGDMMGIGDQTVEDVKAAAAIKAYDMAMMKEHNMSETHHLMVTFSGVNGHPLSKGRAAVKVTDPAGKTSEPIKMMGMEGAFGADVKLGAKGKYVLEVACKLEDGKKRQFQFDYHVK